MMLLILVDEVNPRIEYVFEYIFGSRSLTYTFTSSVDDYESDRSGIRFNYSNKETSGGRWIRPSSIMMEKGAREVLVEKVQYEGIDCLSIDGVVDPVASVFYILTRYEEYNLEICDLHGRFPFEYSILNKLGLIDRAMCDHWSRFLIDLLDKDLSLEAAIRTSLTKGGMRFVPTFDIDNSFAYLHKKGLRKVFSTAKDVLNADWNRIKERKKVNSGEIKDPYDTYDKIEEVALICEETRIFWLVGDKGDKDRNISVEQKDQKELIQRLESSLQIGLHPGYQSFGSGEKISNELKRLESICGHPITSSRQHFLRFRLPKTYRQLLNAGITDEYSMGFAEHTGFRCGTARAHPWFDLNTNEKTDLMIHPFVYMDGTLREYMKLTIEESKDLIRELHNEVKRTGGDFVFIWHNETIGNYNEWKGWEDVLNFTLNLKHG